MNEFVNFIDVNLNQAASNGITQTYKIGLSNLEFLETNHPFNPLDYARFMYIKNLCLNEPVPFYVPDILCSEERALMYLSFNDFENSFAALSLPIECEVIGTTAIKSSGASINMDVVDIKHTESKEMLEFTYDNINFPYFKAQPLNKKEILWIYIKMMEIYKNEENENIKNFKVLAFLRRVLFGTNNQLEGMLKKAFLLIFAEFTNGIRELEKEIDIKVEINENLFSNPIIWRSEIQIQMGRSLIATYDFSSAYDLLKPFPLFYEKINCLVAMKRSEDAVIEINKYIDLIQNSSERKNKIILSDLYIKLGHLYQNPAYFDLAGNTFLSHKPYLLKGMHYFRNKNYAEALNAFETAVGITPNNEDVLFSYACALFELDRVLEAQKIFKRLNRDNPLNEKITKNLSYCYYKMCDIENTLETLRSIALQDHEAMKQFLYISMRNDMIENVCWALKRMNYDNILHDVINYLIQHQKITPEKIREMLLSNAYFRDVEIEMFFK